MPLSHSQHRVRARALGSSDAGTACRLNPHRTWYDLWLEKTGRRLRAEETTEAQHFGTLLEPLLAREYTRRTGHRVRRVRRTLVHRDHPWMVAHLDRVVIGERRLLEIKTTSFMMHQHWGPDGTPIVDAAEGADETAPAHYIAQLTHAMLVYRATRADLAVLIGGNDFRIYPMTLDRVFAEALVDRERTFWFGFVVPDKTPPPMTLNDIHAMYPKDNGTAIAADRATRQHVHRLRRLRSKQGEIKTAIDHHSFAIKNHMGEHRTLVDSTGRALATWKHHEQRQLDQKRLSSDHPDIVNNHTRQITKRPFLLK